MTPMGLVGLFEQAVVLIKTNEMLMLVLISERKVCEVVGSAS